MPLLRPTSSRSGDRCSTGLRPEQVTELAAIAERDSPSRPHEQGDAECCPSSCDGEAEEVGEPKYVGELVGSLLAPSPSDWRATEYVSADEAGSRVHRERSVAIKGFF